MANENNTIVGLDIGSSKVCAAICKIEADQELNLLGIGTSVTAGITKGMITDADELMRSIERALKRAEKEAHIRPVRVICNIPLQGMQFVHNVGILLSKEPTGQISESERIECVRRSRNVIKSADQKMIHALPMGYKVDGLGVQHPVGVFGQSLEVQTHVILAPSETLMSLTQVLKELHLHISGLMFDLLASAQLYLTEEERKQGSVLVDIGGRFTKVGLFRAGQLFHSFTLPIGGDVFTQDLAQCLKVSIPEAERLKIIFGDVTLSRVNPNETIEITTLEEGRKTIKKQLICQILEARSHELLQYIQKKMPKLQPSDRVVLGGGGSLLKGLFELFQAHFSQSVREGIPDDIQSVIESSSYSTAIGLVLYALRTKAIAYAPVPKNPFKKVKQWVDAFF